MADREVIHERRGGTGTTLLSWLAILLAIAALALSWVAFNRTGEDLESKIQRQVEQSTNNVQQEVEQETPNTTPTTNPETDTRGDGTPEDN